VHFVNKALSKLSFISSTMKVSKYAAKALEKETPRQETAVLSLVPEEEEEETDHSKSGSFKLHTNPADPALSLILALL
jgi:hypothetical protein